MAGNRRKFVCPRCQMENFGKQDRCLACGAPAPDTKGAAQSGNGAQLRLGKPQKFCSACGQPVKPGLKFCVKCGAEVKRVGQ